VVPEDQEIPLGGVSFDGPGKKILQDLRVAGIRLAECLHAVPVIPAAFRDQETPGLLVLQAVKLDQNIDVLCGARLGHLLDVPKRRPVEVVVPGHINHDRPFGLAVVLNLCLVYHHAPFRPIITGSNFRGDGKGYDREKAKKGDTIGAIGRESLSRRYLESIFQHQ